MSYIETPTSPYTADNEEDALAAIREGGVIIHIFPETTDENNISQEDMQPVNKS